MARYRVLQGVRLIVEAAHYHGGILVHMEFKELTIGERQHLNRLNHGLVVAAQVVRAFARKQVFKQHRGEGRRTAMARYVCQKENHFVLADLKVIGEVAA